jgi:sec-independent protein translocase protein TatA
MGGISIWQLLIILAVVLVIFGTKRLRTLGSDLGASIRGFRDAMKEGERPEDHEASKRLEQTGQERVIDAEANRENLTGAEINKEKNKV